MKYANITQQTGPFNMPPPGQYGSTYWHGTPPWDVAFEHGVRKITVPDTSETPEGYRRIRSAWEQDPADAEGCVEQAQFEPIPPTPEPVPEFFEYGIESSLLVLQTESGKGVGYAPTEDGGLVPVVYVHESPCPPAAEIAARIAAAREARAKATTDIRAATAAANSVPALRAQVARILDILEGRP